MQFSLETKTASLSVGEFAGFTLGPHESGGGPQGLWRAQLGQHWHNELRARTVQEFTVDGALHPGVQFEAVIDGRLVHRGWTFALNGRIDQIVPLDCRAGSPDPALQKKKAGVILREIKSVMRPLPAEEAALRADYPAYFLQLAAYAVLFRNSALNHQPFCPATAGTNTGLAPASNGATLNRSALSAELVFVEAGAGLSQTIALTPFDEALVFHQLDAVVEFLNLRLKATARRRALSFHPAFPSLRPGQEDIQADLQAVFAPLPLNPNPPSVLFFEAPTGYGKTGCVLEYALGQLRSGRFARVIWLTGKSTGQIQVMHTLRQMTTADSSNAIRYTTPLAAWQVRNKSEHCVNHTFHCVRDGCDYLAGCAERWPQSGLAKFYLDDAQPHDLDTVRAAGRDARICPYEITRTSLAFNDVWVGDYNYVFAPDNRGLFFDQPGFDPAETLLIIDEAHNLPSRVAGAYSHRVTASEVRFVLAELDHQQAPATLVLAVEEWARLLTSLQPAESLDPAVEADIMDILGRLANLVSTLPLDYAALGPKCSHSLWQNVTLHDWLEGRVGGISAEAEMEFSTDELGRSEAEITRLLWVSREGELEFTCVDAAPAIGATLAEFGGTILMSATLQPYENMAAACGMTAPHYATLHAPTPWRAGAYDVAVDVRVDTSFKQRGSYYGTTAATIEAMHAAACVSQLSTHLPGDGPDKHRAGSSQQRRNSQPTATAAVAVFFPSYAYAESVQRALENSGSVLRTAMQPRLPDLAAQTAWVEENLVLADALFLVLGSSFAEGIDLLGGRVTHAMVVGPALPEVNAVQKKRLDALASLGRDAAFRRVYQIPGLQKVNQALGRLVRAPGQHAKVLLHCRRFADASYAALLAADYQMYREIGSEADLCDWLAS